MELSDIIKLLDAGFTKDDIMALQVSPAAPAAPSADSDPAPASDSDPAPAADPAEDQPGLSAMQAFNTLINKMNDKLDQIQAANIVNTSTGTPDQEETAESVLQELIFPGSK